MTTTTTLTEQDVDYLRTLLGELIDAGRKEEAASIARVHAVVCEIVYADILAGDEEDEELAREYEEAMRDLEAGRLIPHEEVVRRLQALHDAEDHLDS